MQQQAFIALKFPSKHTSTGADIIEKKLQKRGIKKFRQVKNQSYKIFLSLVILKNVKYNE